MEQQKEKKPSLFREKSLEAMNSPEALNDYLRVTSPGVWLVLAAVIAVLIGAIVWGIFGRINTTVSLAVSVSGGDATAWVPYASLQAVLDGGSVTLEGREMALATAEQPEILVVDADTNPLLRLRGGCEIGDVLAGVQVSVPADAGPEDGVYTAEAVTESLQPISLLLH